MVPEQCLAHSRLWKNICWCGWINEFLGAIKEYNQRPFYLPNDTHRKIHLPKFPPRGAESLAPCCLSAASECLFPVGKAWKAMKKLLPLVGFCSCETGFSKLPGLRTHGMGLILFSSAPFSEIVWFNATASFWQATWNILLYENKHGYNREWDTFDFFFKTKHDLSKNF